MNKTFLALGLAMALTTVSALAVEGFYLGAEVGAVGGNNLDTQLGYGGDLGARVNSLFDVMARVQHSTHNNSLLNLTSTTVSADFRILDMGDFEVAVGAGPGFYFTSTPLTSSTQFGLNYGGEIDAVIAPGFHIGVGGRFNQVFSGNNYWTATMRVGFMFGTGN